MNVSVPRKVLHCGVFSATGTGFNVVIQYIRPVILETSVIMVILEVLCFFLLFYVQSCVFHHFFLVTFSADVRLTL
jgi:hypothetical protein